MHLCSFLDTRQKNACESFAALACMEVGTWSFTLSRGVVQAWAAGAWAPPLSQSLPQINRNHIEILRENKNLKNVILTTQILREINFGNKKWRMKITEFNFTITFLCTFFRQSNVFAKVKCWFHGIFWAWSWYLTHCCVNFTFFTLWTWFNAKFDYLAKNSCFLHFFLQLRNFSQL